MAFRGRGRGRGFGGGGGFGFAKAEKFELFPEDVVLPDRKGVPEVSELAVYNSRLLLYWRDSAFHLDESALKKIEIKKTDIERYSDRAKAAAFERDSLSQILQLTSNNFPRELIGGSVGSHHSKKRVRWNPDSGLRKLDFLEKLEQRGVKVKGEKEGEEEEEEEEEEELAEQESSDDDYYQNEYFDDDEDDFNMADEGDDEPIY